MTRVAEPGRAEIIWQVAASGELTPISTASASLAPPYIVVPGFGEWPAQGHVGGRTYEHLRSGIYIAADASEDEIACLFDGLSPVYESTHVTVPFNLAMYRLLAQQTKRCSSLDRFACVLDFGSGTGLSAPILSDEFPDADHLGFDLAPGMRRLASARGLRMVDWSHESFGLPPNSVDVILGAFVLFFLKTERWYREFGRIVRPGGAVAFNLFNPGPDWRSRYGEAFERVGFRTRLAQDMLVESPALSAQVPVLVCEKV